jgi:hypothetical protein
MATKGLSIDGRSTEERGSPAQRSLVRAQVKRSAGSFRQQAASVREDQVCLARTTVVSASRKKDSKRTYFAVAALRDAFAHASRSIFFDFVTPSPCARAARQLTAHGG